MKPVGCLLFVLACLLLVGCAVDDKDKGQEKDKGDKPKPKKDDTPPTVRKAECRYASNVIRINGVLDDVAWENPQELTGFSPFWQKRPAATKTTARLLWDRTYLYFSAEMEDADLFALTKERNGMTWEDD